MKCPGCQTALRLRDDMAGKKIKCPRCGKIVAVPAEEIVELEEVSEGEQITAEPPRPGKSRPTAARTRPVREDDEEDEEEEDAPRRSKYKPCPRCGARGAKRVIWTFWGSFYGPALFTHVRCRECGCAYNGRSGRSNLIPAIVFVAVPLLILLAILGGLVWFIHRQGYF